MRGSGGRPGKIKKMATPGYRFLGFWHRGWGGRDRGRDERRRLSVVAHPSNRYTVRDTDHRRYLDPYIPTKNLACGVVAVLRRRTSLMWPEDITALRNRRIADSPFSFSPTVTWREGNGRDQDVSLRSRR